LSECPEFPSDDDDDDEEEEDEVRSRKKQTNATMHDVSQSVGAHNNRT
jgi:hypothetical protein